MKTIKARIMAVIISIVILLCGVLGTISVVFNINSAKNVMEKNMQEIANISAARIQKELEITRQVAIQAGCTARLSDPAVSKEEKQKIIDQIIKNNGYLGGNLLDSSGLSVLDGSDLYKDRDYFLSAVKGDAFISGPTVSRKTGEYSVLVAAPVWKNGESGTQVVGVVYFKPDVQLLSQIVSTIHIGQTGGAYLLTKDGLTMAHSDASLVFKQNATELAKKDKSFAKIAKIEKNMMAGATGYDTYDKKGVTWAQAYAPVQGTDGWSVGIYVQQDEFMGSVRTTILLTVIISVLFLVAGVILSLIFSKSIVKPVNIASKYLVLMAKGETMQPLNEKDFIGELKPIANSYNQVRESLYKLLEDTGMLSDAAAKGNLTVRADAEQHHGGYRQIIEGINNAFNEIVNPMKEITGVLIKISVNDYTSALDGDYKGDLKVLADAVIDTRSRLLSVQQAFVNLAVGDMSLLEAFEKVGKRSENDQILPACIRTMRTLNTLTDDANDLIANASAGILDTRGDAAKYNGKYRQLIEGINSIMDAMVTPVNDAIEQMNRMADNDFTCGMSEQYGGDFAKLAMSFNSVIDTMNQTLSDIGVAAEQVASGTQQVSSGTQALSQGATEQASAIEELTASVTEIADQTKQNAVNAQQANEFTFAARDEAVEGNNRMLGLQQAMKEINDASTNISKIIKVIDDIAFQTNLLALNAAVEAARAGQHGKGFAVVAEEVRNLAQRSANAARETTDMIEESIKRVKAGTQMADETAQSLTRIVTGVEKATELVGGIAKASSDQATAVAQVNGGIEQVSQVTQTNSATAEESAAASEELSSQATLLKEMVGRFNLKDQGVSPAPSALPAAKAQRSGKTMLGKPKIALNDAEFGKY